MIVPQQNISVFGELTVSTETDPMVRFQMKSDPKRSTKSREDPPAYPIPKDRVQKSANVVPNVVVATMVIQYMYEFSFFLRICVITRPIKNTEKIIVPIR